MPLQLDAPQTYRIQSEIQISRIRVVKIMIDDLAPAVHVWIVREQQGVDQAVDGHFTIEDLAEEKTYTVGGKSYTVSAGSYLTDASVSAPAGSSNRAVIKNSIYSALAAMYGLAGSVS